MRMGDRQNWLNWQNRLNGHWAWSMEIKRERRERREKREREGKEVTIRTRQKPEDRRQRTEDRKNGYPVGAAFSRDLAILTVSTIYRLPFTI